MIAYADLKFFLENPDRGFRLRPLADAERTRLELCEHSMILLMRSGGSIRWLALHPDGKIPDDIEDDDAALHALWTLVARNIDGTWESVRALAAAQPRGTA